MGDVKSGLLDVERSIYNAKRSCELLATLAAEQKETEGLAGFMWLMMDYLEAVDEKVQGLRKQSE